MLRLVGQVETGNGLVPHPHVAFKNQEGHLSGKCFPLETKVLALHCVSQPGLPVLGRGVATTASCENQQGLSPVDLDGC